jgi:hypothetical protein
MTTTTTTLLLSREQLHLHLQLKELHESEKGLFKNMGSDHVADVEEHHDDCRTASDITETSLNSLKTPLPLSRDESLSSNCKCRRSILKYRTHGDSLLAMSSSSCYERIIRKVGFSMVEIREHAIILGDNPGCVSGPPLSIDWPCEKKRTFEFEAYEANRPERRVRAAMQMNKEIRIKLFKSLGYSAKDIVRLTKPVNIARQQRLHTIATLQTHGIQESTEKITRVIKNNGKDKTPRTQVSRAVFMQDSNSITSSRFGRLLLLFCR